MIYISQYNNKNRISKYYSDSNEDSNSNQSKSDLDLTTKNEIYFYSDIFSDTAFLLNKAIADLEKSLKIIQINLDLAKPPPIKLYINSLGGDPYEAFSIVDRIQNCKVPVYSYVEGKVGSAATLLSLSAHRRFISKNSVMLFHQISTWFSGTYENHIDERKNFDMIMERVKNFYVGHSKISMEELEELLKHDLDLSAEECLKYGFIDQII